MKNGTCTKCESQDIIKIPGSVGPHGSGNNITAGMTIFSSVKVTRFLCVDCGFSEEWVLFGLDREKLKKRYAT